LQSEILSVVSFGETYHPPASKSYPGSGASLHVDSGAKVNAGFRFGLGRNPDIVSVLPDGDFVDRQSEQTAAHNKIGNHFSLGAAIQELQIGVERGQRGTSARGVGAEATDVGILEEFECVKSDIALIEGWHELNVAPNRNANSPSKIIPCNPVIGKRIGYQWHRDSAMHIIMDFRFILAKSSATQCRKRRNQDANRFHYSSFSVP
jgi:hypothetical protein